MLFHVGELVKVSLSDFTTISIQCVFIYEAVLDAAVNNNGNPQKILSFYL